ncbi:hypothetical protein [Acinetobacter sp. Marseille-Q1618]|uniref:hypothetical protein n=1 Tax=Acinetobacter sp. Marseille-Q1618 TaxID=2697502 RepID=UPI00156FDCD7|nr:hypothetical protein [Acinetobacter sp. Marseille-Q1618]
MNKKKYFASHTRMKIVAIFTVLFACPFWLASIFASVEIVQFNHGLKSLYLLILLLPILFIAYLLSRNAYRLFKNQQPILTLTPIQIRTIDYKGQGVHNQTILLKDISEIELKKTWLDRHYYLVFHMRDQTKQQLNFATGWMKNEDIVGLKNELDKWIKPKTKQIH